jgi:LCP family protein required for cell wall assembly
MGGRRAATKDSLTEEVGGGAPGGRAAGRRARKGSRRRVLRWVGGASAVVLVATGGGAYYLYSSLAGNIKHAQLYQGASQAKSVGVEKPDAFGRTPVNLLLIGSDTRDTAEDCRLGGACSNGGGGANADVEMIVHLSADRSNISVMSIPRDLMTELPACTDPVTHASQGAHYGQINSTLQYSPSCTATAIHQLTGIPIDQFAMVDFGGVVDMSNALGGVNLCFSSSFYDINSGLKLTEGQHMLQGKAALEFLRTRDSFGDGSDNIGRTSATHEFFTAMINKLKNAGTITDLPAMYGIADAATKSLTVSPGLDTPLKLIDLADDLNKVPTDRITFTTMQNSPDPENDSRVLIAPGATALFSAIANDQSLTTPSGASSGAGTVPSSAAPTVKASAVTVAVYNGTNGNGWSDTIAAALVSDGFDPATAGYPDTDFPTTTLTYGPGQAAQAQLVAKALGLPAKSLVQGTAAGVKLVLGADWTSGLTFPGSKATPAPANTAVALDNTHSQTAAVKGCEEVQVSTDETENKLGLDTGASWNSPPETPQEMFQIYSNLPNSAP